MQKLISLIDYKKAGFKMLFGGEKSKYPALIAVLTSVIMTIVSVLPFFYNNHHAEPKQLQ